MAKMMVVLMVMLLAVIALVVDSYAIRNARVYPLPRCKTERFKNSCVMWTVPLAVSGHSYSHTNIICYGL